MHDAIRSLLESIESGEISVSSALAKLADSFAFGAPGADIDGHRHLRTNLPEVVFGQFKTPTQTVAILREIFDRCGYALATRVSEEVAASISGAYEARYNDIGRTLSLGRLPQSNRRLPLSARALPIWRFSRSLLQPSNGCLDRYWAAAADNEWTRFTPR